VLAEIERRIPELNQYKSVWDCALSSCTLKKPDDFWFVDKIGIHVEVDESGLDHESDDYRVAEIHAASGMDGTYLIRLNPDEYVDNDGNDVPPCFRRLRLSTGDPRLEATPEFAHRMDVMEETMREVLAKAEAGKIPAEHEWKTELFF